MTWNRVKKYIIYLPEESRYVYDYNLETQEVKLIAYKDQALKFAGHLAADVCAQKLENMKLIKNWVLIHLEHEQ